MPATKIDPVSHLAALCEDCVSSSEENCVVTLGPKHLLHFRSNEAKFFPTHINTSKSKGNYYKINSAVPNIICPSLA